MTDAGLRVIEAARARGAWQKAYSSRKQRSLPLDLRGELLKNEQAWRNFRVFAISY